MDSERSDSDGTWTIKVRGGPAFWSNVLSVISAGVSWSSVQHGGPSAQIKARMIAAEATWEPDDDAKR